MSGANTLFSMLQQMGNALGIAGGAIMLRIAALTHPGEAQVTTTDFHIAFWAIGLVGLAAIRVLRGRRINAHIGSTPDVRLCKPVSVTYRTGLRYVETEIGK
jgi:hypothetical protein